MRLAVKRIASLTCAAALAVSLAALTLCGEEEGGYAQ